MNIDYLGLYLVRDRDLLVGVEIIGAPIVGQEIREIVVDVVEATSEAEEVRIDVIMPKEENRIKIIDR